MCVIKELLLDEVNGVEPHFSLESKPQNAFIENILSLEKRIFALR